MPHTITAWVDGEPTIRIDVDGALLCFPSGGAVFSHRMSHACYRQVCIDGLRGLNAWEDAQESGEVIAIKAAG